MTLSSLSIRNARRQARDYLVYFVTIIITAALIYAFNGLVFSQEMRVLSNMMRSMPLIIVLASLVVVCIISWLVQYTTNFMLSRRSRELGTYILIGLENKQVAKMFFRENLIVGGAALVPGVLLGNLVYQALRALVLALFGKEYHFSFSFSLSALGLTLFYFLLIYLFAQRKSRKRIRSMKIYDLIYFERRNEEAVIQKGSSRKKTFIVSIVLGIIGTVFIMAGDLTIGIIGAGMIIAFLYGFFASFASGVPAYFEKHAEKKYSGQTLLVFRTLSTKLAAMGVLMATISLLFTATIISEGTGLIFRAIFENRYEERACFDLMISTLNPQAEYFRDTADFIEECIPSGCSREYNIRLRDSAEDSCIITKYIKEKTWVPEFYNSDTVMAFSDYAALREILGYPAVVLEPGKYLIQCQRYIADFLKGWDQSLQVGDAVLEFGGIQTEIFAQGLWDVNGGGYILVVPDEVAKTCVFDHRMYSIKTPEYMGDEFYKEAGTLFRSKIKDYEYDEGVLLYIRSEDEKEMASSIATIVFPLYYLALVLTMTAATILTIQQLSETERYRRQFSLLHKLGMEEVDMQNALRKQFTIYYAMPVLPSLMISGPFIWNLANLTDPGVMYGAGGPLMVLGVTFALFFLIYAVYIVMAYSTMKRNVLP